MEKKLFLGGIGGQGVVYGGKMLGAAAVDHGHFATVYASYSPAMRNGFTYSTIILSPDPVLAPVTTYYDCMAFFDADSCIKQSHLLSDGGVYVLNSALVHSEPANKNAQVVKIDASHLANQLGNSKMLNIIMLGAVLGASDLLDPEWMKERIRMVFEKKPKVAEANIHAFDVGYQIAKEQLGK